MHRLYSTLKKFDRLVAMINTRMDIHSLRIDAPGDCLKRRAGRGMARIPAAGPVESLFNLALDKIALSAPRVGENVLRLTMLMTLADSVNPRAFVLDDETIGFPVYGDIDAETLRAIGEFDALFRERFGGRIVTEKTGRPASVLQRRLEEARRYYITEHGEWTQKFMAELEDDLSRDSFATFLQQRVASRIITGSPICYPIAPPAQSRAWRERRAAEPRDLPPLAGCESEAERDLVCLHTFIYEQYAVPGVVEARPGDTVVDAGAYIGDTACYFSEKVGENGRVLAFEILPETAAFARQNAERCGRGNIEVVEKALSDECATFSVVANPYSNAAAYIDDADGATGAEHAVTVEAATLDSLAAAGNMKIDFIKADIEGAEMRMLRGAARTIARDAPVCAICLYHKRDDDRQIPQFLKELRPDYAFWFRCEAEPVLFARKKN